MVVKDKKQFNITMGVFESRDCRESSFKAYDFCSIFCDSIDYFIWNLQLGEIRRKDITVFRKTFYEYVADAYAVLYDIYADTCVWFTKYLCDYAYAYGAVIGGVLCGGLDL